MNSPRVCKGFPAYLDRPSRNPTVRVCGVNYYSSSLRHDPHTTWNFRAPPAVCLFCGRRQTCGVSSLGFLCFFWMRRKRSDAWQGAFLSRWMCARSVCGCGIALFAPRRLCVPSRTGYTAHKRTRRGVRSHMCSCRCTGELVASVDCKP
jgi:hypothetical protein